MKVSRSQSSPLRSWSLCLGTIAAFCVSGLAAGPRPNRFFAFDNGVGRDLGASPARQAEVLATLGYAGIGYTGTADLAARLAAFRAKNLRVFSLYVAAQVDQPAPYDPAILTVLPALQGTGVVLWLTVQGQAPNDEKAVGVVRELADAAHRWDVRVVLYPHKGFFVSTAEEGLRLIKQVDRPNVGITINLCHELAAGHADRMEAIIQACAGRLELVSINGADRTGGWDELIRPLGEGAYDVAGFLRALDRAGYTGPIGLQCYNVKGDPETNLRKSMAAWRRYGGG